MQKTLLGSIAVLTLFAASATLVRGGNKKSSSTPEFRTSDRCVACHNGMKTKAGEDFSIGLDWRSSIMANSSRDPYWQASVRRETLDHPESSVVIQDECSHCHMPIVEYQARVQDKKAEIFSHLPFNADNKGNAEAVDGVSCSVCHQISKKNLGTRASFVGNFVIDSPEVPNQRPEHGPFVIDAGHQRVMQSSTGGCQSCHMPEVQGDTPVTSLFGEPRQGARHHYFVGANFLMQRMLGNYRQDLSVAALPNELTAAAQRTVNFLQSQSARVSIRSVEKSDRELHIDVLVENLTGHKLPTAYPSRRVWLHVVIHDQNGRTVFESGALNPDGSIQGNDNDADRSRFEPHYREITKSDQVQIYEPILGDSEGHVTTGLLAAVGYLKDNRLLPEGFDKSTADPSTGPFHIEVELWYEPIGFRWAHNLGTYQADEPQRLVSYYDSLASGAAVILAKAEATK